MGTNYYLNYDYCPCCGKSRQRIHIGKSSAGWRFLFDMESTKCTNLNQIKEKLRYGNIEDEYHRQISYQDFFNIVEQKQIEEEARNITNDYVNIVDGYEFNKNSFS